MVAQKQHECLSEPLIAQLASLWGVNLGYRDAAGRAQQSPRESIVDVIRELEAGAPAGLRDRLAEPVQVAWDGLLLPACRPGVRLTLHLEDGREQQLVPGSQRVPLGYHHLLAQRQNQVEEAVVISAPPRCWQEDLGTRQWGVFAPAYALRSDRDWGAGDLAEVETLIRTVADAGGSAVATLPLLASYLDRPFEPSPYSPVSRLFWNEFYLAVERLPEWDECPSARAIWESPDTQAKVAALRAREMVDYAGVMALKRTVLQELCSHFFRESGGVRREALSTFVCERPEVLAYADFRARVEKHGCDWRSWPKNEQVASHTHMRIEDLCETGRYHLYAQWQIDEQLRVISGRDSSSGASSLRAMDAGLFLDLPVGVHPGGFDVWSQPGLFVRDVSIGAPPDAFFGSGQRWDCPPLHPERARMDGHSYWRKVLRQHMRFASRLRIDHVMALHRLFWIPEGREPSQGVYVDYPADELYAVLCLESHRHRTSVTGEDLGTVPAGVRPSMRRHGVSGTWVLQSSLRPRSKQVIGKVPGGVVAALGTHDMFPLAGFARGDDIAQGERAGRLDERRARRALAARRRLLLRLTSFLADGSDLDYASALLMSALSYLGKSGAVFLLVGLDDLLLQREPHNIPGTGSEGFNWRRKLDADELKVRRVVAFAAEAMGVDRMPRPD